MRIVGLLLSILVVGGAAFALRMIDRSQQPHLIAERSLLENAPDSASTIALCSEALRRDPANPYRWSDLAWAYESTQCLDQARLCYKRSLQVSGEIPQIWLRETNFRFRQGETDAALVAAARVLRMTNEYDTVLFNYFDGLVQNTSQVLAHIGDNRRITRAYIRHLIDLTDMQAAVEAWHYGFARGFADSLSVSAYVDGLLRVRRYADAQRDWAEYLGHDRGDFPDRNLLFNAGFEREPTGSVFDWRIQPSEDFDTLRDDSTAREGRCSLQIRFHGTGNVSYANVIQTTRITAGRYILQAFVLTKDITTNEGPRLEIFDPESPARFKVRTDSFLGTHDWMLVKQAFTVPAGSNLAAVRVVRDPSQKFDNKINGVLWLDNLRLTRAELPGN